MSTPKTLAFTVNTPTFSAGEMSNMTFLNLEEAIQEQQRNDGVLEFYECHFFFTWLKQVASNNW